MLPLIPVGHLQRKDKIVRRNHHTNLVSYIEKKHNVKENKINLKHQKGIVKRQIVYWKTKI